MSTTVGRREDRSPAALNVGRGNVESAAAYAMHRKAGHQSFGCVVQCLRHYQAYGPAPGTLRGIPACSVRPVPLRRQDLAEWATRFDEHEQRYPLAWQALPFERTDISRPAAFRSTVSSLRHPFQPLAGAGIRSLESTKAPSAIGNHPIIFAFLYPSPMSRDGTGPDAACVLIPHSRCSHPSYVLASEGVRNRANHRLLGPIADSTTNSAKLRAS